MRGLHRSWWIASLAFLVVAGSLPLLIADDAPKPTETASADKAKSDEYYELMRIFADSFEEIDRNYVTGVDRRRLVEAAVRGMITELKDPYSNYINPEELTEFNEAVEQEFGGVGIQVRFDDVNRVIIVTSPLAGSPAYKAGIQSGDRIVEIEGKPVGDFPTGKEMQQAIKMLKGEPGVTVSFGYKRGEDEEVKKVSMKREIIQLDTVLGETHRPDGTWDYYLDGDSKIAYLRLTHFTSRSATEMRDALKNLKASGMKGLILDLRFNPGGFLQSAIQIADLFIDDGKIVSTEGRNSPERVWTAKKFGTYGGFPMVVMVNRFSASASEIVSACLQDHNRAIVVGERSWGKGSVQNVMDVEEGKSKLKLTIATYHRPSGKNIHRSPGDGEKDEWGVKPNDGFEVKFSQEQMIEYQIFRQKKDSLVGDGEKPDFDDKQLDKAIEYLKGELAKQPASEEKKNAA
jgi:carboxyl-terminal processing protease